MMANQQVDLFFLGNTKGHETGIYTGTDFGNFSVVVNLQTIMSSIKVGNFVET